MGQWMGIPGFDDFKEYLQLNKEINQANQQDSKKLRDGGVDANIVRGVFISIRNPKMPDMELPIVTHTWMMKIRERFTVHVIQRTIDSVDYEGRKLFGMHPYIEHVLKLKMYNWEIAGLRNLAKDLVKENPIASSDTRKVSFYLFASHCALAVLDGHTHHVDYWQYLGTMVVDTTLEGIWPSGQVAAWHGRPVWPTVCVSALDQVYSSCARRDGRPGRPFVSF